MGRLSVVREDSAWCARDKWNQVTGKIVCDINPSSCPFSDTCARQSEEANLYFGISIAVTEKIGTEPRVNFFHCKNNELAFLFFGKSIEFSAQGIGSDTPVKGTRHRDTIRVEAPADHKISANMVSYQPTNVLCRCLRYDYTALVGAFDGWSIAIGVDHQGLSISAPLVEGNRRARLPNQSIRHVYALTTEGDELVDRPISYDGKFRHSIGTVPIPETTCIDMRQSCRVAQFPPLVPPLIVRPVKSGR